MWLLNNIFKTAERKMQNVGCFVDISNTFIGTTKSYPWFVTQRKTGVFFMNKTICTEGHWSITVWWCKQLFKFRFEIKQGAPLFPLCLTVTLKPVTHELEIGNTVTLNNTIETKLFTSGLVMIEMVIYSGICVRFHYLACLKMHWFLIKTFQIFVSIQSNTLMLNNY